ncbi:MAG: arginine repressor [Deinococcus sp.]|nr:arginine repressor [Deinococcus sp.]
MMNKQLRQRRIREIVSSEPISTQLELVERLGTEGVRVTQATISRDINELRLVRIPTGNGRHRYAVSPVELEEDLEQELAKIFKNFVKGVDNGGNVVVIKTAPGHAGGVGSVIDRLEREDIVGCVAGDDAVLVVTRSTSAAQALVEELSQQLT